MWLSQFGKVVFNGLPFGRRFMVRGDRRFGKNKFYFDRGVSRFVGLMWLSQFGKVVFNGLPFGRRFMVRGYRHIGNSQQFFLDRDVRRFQRGVSEIIAFHINLGCIHLYGVVRIDPYGKVWIGLYGIFRITPVWVCLEGIKTTSLEPLMPTDLLLFLANCCIFLANKIWSIFGFGTKVAHFY